MSDKAQSRRWGDHLARVRPLAPVGVEHVDPIKAATAILRDLGLEPTTELIAKVAPHVTPARYSQVTIGHMAMHLEEKRGIILHLQDECDQVKRQAGEDRHHAAIYIGAQELYIHRLEQAILRTLNLARRVDVGDPVDVTYVITEHQIGLLQQALAQKGRPS